MRRVLGVLSLAGLVVLAAATAAAAGGGGHGGASCRAFGEAVTIVMRDNCFDAIAPTVAPGMTVTVTNAGDLPHTITAVDGSFDSGIVEPGGSFRLDVGDEEGMVPVYCTLHGSADGSGMAGLVRVSAAADADDGLAATSAGGLGAAPGWLVAGLVGAAAGVTLGRRTRRSAAVTR
jgi:plastocyanin